MAGKSYNDRELASEVRTMALEEVKKVLKRKKGKLYEAVLIRLSGTVLPRLNELSGVDGGPIKIEGNKIAFADYGESESNNQ